MYVLELTSLKQQKINQILIFCSKDVYLVQTKRMECKFNTEIIKNGKCSLKLVRKSSNLMNMSLDFAYPQKEFKVNYIFKFDIRSCLHVNIYLHYFADASDCFLPFYGNLSIFFIKFYKRYLQ